jgi:hypothetical protein
MARRQNPHILKQYYSILNTHADRLRFDADPNKDPDFHFDADSNPDPDPTL